MSENEVMAMAVGKRPRELIERNSDPAEWGEKSTDDAYDGPLNIAGEEVDVASLPRFGPEPSSGKGSGSTPAPVRRA